MGSNMEMKQPHNCISTVPELILMILTKSLENSKNMLEKLTLSLSSELPPV